MKNNNLLETIGKHKQGEIAALKEQFSLSELEALAKSAAPTRGFAHALTLRDTNIIAELKKASPSRGLIRENFDPAALARQLTKAGAACLSVLTDQHFFQGSDANLQQARLATDIPIIQKDFFYDIIQVLIARALGADAVLLIMAALEKTQAQELAACAREWGLDILPEVHNETELEAALALKPKLIGINNRDLKTFTTDLTISERLAPLAPKETVLVCESGIHTRADIERMKKNNIHAFLIGEGLMKQDDVGAALKELL